ncbi:cytochrome P450 [Apiospora rasikravindrae]|uniref:Cytochrome P450 n=1 Tax=Apiospora rasikravindrae TaxID=990691 RepID=A0ABR1RP09_9PEZI
MFLPLVAAVVTLTVAVLYRKLQFLRFQQYANLPQHPTSLVLGHLQVFGDYFKRNRPDAHPDMAIAAMSQALGRPPLMYVDLRPISQPMAVVGDHNIADQLTRATPIFPTSPPKSSRSLNRLQYIMGPSSIFSTHGDEWKRLRKRFSPGFSPQYLLGFVPETLEKGLLFTERLEALSKTGDSFSLMKLTTQLTFDVIGKVTMGADLGAQHDNQEKADDLVQSFEILVDAYNGDRLNLPWWLNLGKTRKRAALSSCITNLLQNIVSHKHAELHDREGKKGKGTKSSRNVLSMALQDVETLTPRPCGGASQIARADGSVATDALRRCSPGGTARAIPPGSGFTVRMPDGQQQCLDGLLVYNCQSLIHTDPNTFGRTAGDFVPERWLSADRPGSVPAGAWRAFERGPRNCIGQELANMEARVVLALTAHRFDFCKVGLGEVVRDGNGQPRLDPNTQGRYQVGEELYMVSLS